MSKTFSEKVFFYESTLVSGVFLKATPTHNRVDDGILLEKIEDIQTL